MEKEPKDLILTKAGPEVEKPEAVEEAEKALRRWGLSLVGTGAVGSIAYWMALLQFDVYFPLQWWFVFLATLVAVFFFSSESWAEEFSGAGTPVGRPEDPTTPRRRWSQSGSDGASCRGDDSEGRRASSS